VHAVLHNGEGKTPRISFLFTALHEKADVDRALAALAPVYAETG
jgi:hypothetical protein